MVTGKYSPKYVLMLLESLPQESRLITRLRGGDEYLGWDRHAYILADLVDSIQGLSHLYVTAHTKKKPKEPAPYPRPGIEPESKVKKEPNPLLIALKEDQREDVPGPGSVIPLPPERNLKEV